MQPTTLQVEAHDLMQLESHQLHLLLEPAIDSDPAIGSSAGYPTKSNCLDGFAANHLQHHRCSDATSQSWTRAAQT